MQHWAWQHSFFVVVLQYMLSGAQKNKHKKQFSFPASLKQRMQYGGISLRNGTCERVENALRRVLTVSSFGSTTEHPRLRRHRLASELTRHHR